METAVLEEPVIAHRRADLDIQRKDEDAAWRVDCRKICYAIEKELAAWCGELQLKYLSQYLAGRM